MPRSTFVPHLKQLTLWTRRGGFGALDQGLYSGANFLINILLARWLRPEEYGAFTVAFSIVPILMAFHSSFLTEPMLVFGTSRYGGRFCTYLGVLIYGHFAMAIAIALICAAASVIFHQVGSPIIAGTLAGLALGSPFILLASLARRAFYVLLKPHCSAAGSALYLVTMMMGVYACYRWGLLTGGCSAALMGFSAGVTSLAILAVLKPVLKPRLLRQLMKGVLSDHWRYGRWAAGSSLLSSSYSAFYYILMTAFTSLSSVAMLRAVQNLFAPASQLLVSVALPLVPWAAERSAKYGPACLTRHAVRISAALVAAALLYLLVIVSAGSRLVDLLYAGRYSVHLWLILLVAIVQLFTASGGGAHVALRASGRSDLLFIVYAAGSFLSLLGSLILAGLWGFRGAAVAMGVFPLSTSTMAWCLWMARGRKTADGASLCATPKR
jgi:O-antigen/teichoic acid export membrane protein